MHWIGLFLVLFGLLFTIAHLAQHDLYKLDDRTLTGDARMEKEKADARMEKEKAEWFYYQDKAETVCQNGYFQKRSSFCLFKYYYACWIQEQLDQEPEDNILTFAKHQENLGMVYELYERSESDTITVWKTKVDGVFEAAKVSKFKGENLVFYTHDNIHSGSTVLNFEKKKIYELKEKLTAGEYKKVQSEWWKDNSGNYEIWSAENVADRSDTVAVLFMWKKQTFYDLMEYKQNSCFFNVIGKGCSVTISNPEKITYTLEKELASGSYGQVWKAQNKKSKYAAVKLVKTMDDDTKRSLLYNQIQSCLRS